MRPQRSSVPERLTLGHIRFSIIETVWNVYFIYPAKPKGFQTSMSQIKPVRKKDRNTLERNLQQQQGTQTVKHQTSKTVSGTLNASIERLFSYLRILKVFKNKVFKGSLYLFKEV